MENSCEYPTSFQIVLAGTYSRITVTAPADIAGTYGCAPAMFGSTNAKAGSEVSTLRSL